MSINLVYYIYDADFRDLVELHEVGAREKLAKSVNFLLPILGLLCEPSG